MPERHLETGSSSENDATSPPRPRRSIRKADLEQHVVQVVKDQSRNLKLQRHSCGWEGSEDGRMRKRDLARHHSSHGGRARGRCSSAVVVHPSRPSERAKPAGRVPRLVVSSSDTWNVAHRPRKTAFVAPPPVTTTSLWDSVGGLPQQPRDLSPSSASANTDDLLERDEEAIELRAELARTQRERAEFGRRLQEVEIRMRRVRAEMDDLRGRQQDRQEHVASLTRKRWQ